MNNELIHIEQIQKRIFTIRDVQVMLDSDLAKIYGVETKVFNQAVKRNIVRFPDSFRFQLTREEYDALLRSQIVTLKNGRGKHRKYLPYVFTEQGVAMLASVLRSDTAVKVSIQIMQAFVEMKKFIAVNAGIFQRLEKVEQKQIETDQKFEQIFKALEDKSIKPKQGIFYDGQVFDAYKFVAGLVRKTNKSILLIDNYIDETILNLLTKKKNNVAVTIFTNKISKAMLLDVEKFNAQ